MTAMKKIVVAVTPDHIKAVTEIAGCADVSYWASVEWTSRGSGINFEVEEQEAGQPAKGMVTLQYLVLAAAVALADKKFTNEYQRAAFASLLFRPNDVDYDSETGDLLLQYAAFGEVVYG